MISPRDRLTEADDGATGFELAKEELIEAAQHRDSGADPLTDAFTPEDPARLLYEQDPKREVRSFVLTFTRAMGSKRGRGEGHSCMTRALRPSRSTGI